MRAWVGLSVSLVLLATTGCRDELIVSEVVVVLDSDLAIPSEVNAVDMAVITGPIAPIDAATLQQSLAGEFPVPLGFVTRGNTSSFSFIVRLLVWETPTSALPEIVVVKTVSDVRFVAGEKRMLVLPMSRACACEGTTCPLPGNPACDSLRNPALEPLDPNVAPPSPMMTTVF